MPRKKKSSGEGGYLLPAERSRSGVSSRTGSPMARIYMLVCRGAATLAPLP